MSAGIGCTKISKMFFLGQIGFESKVTLKKKGALFCICILLHGTGLKVFCHEKRNTS